MHKRRPAGLVAFVDITARGQCLANGGYTIRLVTDGMAFVNRIDY